MVVCDHRLKDSKKRLFIFSEAEASLWHRSKEMDQPKYEMKIAAALAASECGTAKLERIKITLMNSDPQ